ncbi:hypothetical protein [Listeria booriae]|uniref:hypothetical protein n=1 Tax=Listeria booriae TaxID=1552123 RepID=UPI001626108F|nr:hypothetical protein [Listeria booriae]MBC1212459.1 hypothetical protein [Listeria booriae]MBC1309334.1 hypothetical protein [Listeria booriae]
MSEKSKEEVEESTKDFIEKLYDDLSSVGNQTIVWRLSAIARELDIKISEVVNEKQKMFLEQNRNQAIHMAMKIQNHDTMIELEKEKSKDETN